MKKIDEKKTLAQNAQNFVKIILSQTCIFVRRKMLKKFTKKIDEKKNICSECLEFSENYFKPNLYFCQGRNA